MKRLSLILALLFGGVSVVYSLEPGQTAPTCPAQPQDGVSGLDPQEYRGKVLLIDFWATWCGPCQKSIPFFNRLYHERVKDGFEIVAVNLDEEPDAAKNYLAGHPVSYSVAFDPSGECPKNYQVQAMPSSYLLDKTGKIRYVHLGFHDRDKTPLEEEIQTLINE